MHRIPKNPSQIYSEQSVSGTEEAHPSSGSKRRARSSSPLVSSALAKRIRGDVGEAPKSNLGSFDKARFDEVDARMKEKYEQSGITTGTHSLTINDSPSCFAEAFEAANLSYEEDWRLNDDFFPLAILFDAGSQERLEERGENQNDSAGNSLTDLPTAHTDDWLAAEDGEMSVEGEPEANHAALSGNEVQAVEENAGQQAKLKGTKYVKWTLELKEMASNIIQANANPKLSGRKLYALLRAKCEAQKPKLACPSYKSFRLNVLKQSRETSVQWTLELKEMASNIAQANANADPKLSGRKLHTLLRAQCHARDPNLACPGYDSFRKTFLEKSYETPVRWTDELRAMASNIVQANADPKLSGRKLYARLTAQCHARDPNLACPSYESFWKKFLAKPRNPDAMDV